MKDHLVLLQQELKQDVAILMDVREQEEWQAGHLKGAVYLPLSRLLQGSSSGIAALGNKDSKIYTYCRSGNRSFTARDILRALGYHNVVALSEGFKELVKVGFEADYV